MDIKTAAREPVDVELKFPIQFGEEKIEKVTVHRINQKMIEDAEEAGGKNKQKQMRILIQKTTGLTPNVVAEMDAADYNAICEVVANFMGASQT